MSANELLDKALERIESESIKKWVQSQREVWITLGVKPLMKRHGTNVDRLVVAIMAEAIGL